MGRNLVTAEIRRPLLLVQAWQQREKVHPQLPREILIDRRTTILWKMCRLQFSPRSKAITRKSPASILALAISGRNVHSNFEFNSFRSAGNLSQCGESAEASCLAASRVLVLLDISSIMRRTRSARITSDAFAATKVALDAIQASADVFPPLKSAVSAVIVLLELREKAKSNKKGCEHIAKRSAQLVQDIWRQTKDFGVALPAEVLGSVVEIEKLFIEIEKFFEELTKENLWERLTRGDRNKSQVEEYGRLLDEAMLHFSINLELGTHRLHLESIAADRERHADVLDVARMSESERVMKRMMREVTGSDMALPHVRIGLFLPSHKSGAMSFGGGLCIHGGGSRMSPATPETDGSRPAVTALACAFPSVTQMSSQTNFRARIRPPVPVQSIHFDFVQSGANYIHRLMTP
ncbi:hypothetical protein B0H13DRAFT_2275795 [Mycena leptocephala]|nr:hypothetical protein B0H13DRAFT_2275795 [Mycena leptocephala]